MPSTERKTSTPHAKVAKVERRHTDLPELNDGKALRNVGPSLIRAFSNHEKADSLRKAFSTKQ